MLTMTIQAKHLKTDTGRDAREQVVIKTKQGVTAYQSVGKTIVVTSPNRTTLVNAEHLDSNQITIKYIKQFIWKDEYSKKEIKLYLDMKHFRYVSDEVIETIWDIESNIS